jgi:hypothetical protein
MFAYGAIMAYSRLMDSAWSIYWSTRSGTTFETQRLAVEPLGKEHALLSPTEVEEMLGQPRWERWPDLPPEEIDWVKEGFRRWLDDVLVDYPMHRRLQKKR